MLGKSSDNAVICDSSSLISMTESCLLGLLEDLSTVGGGFYISNRVKQECIDTPINMKAHSLTAVRLKDALDRGVIRLDEENHEEKIREIVWIANNIFHIRGKPLRLIHAGEADMIATALSVGTKNILIDERTTRMLVEDPGKLGEHLEREFKTRVETNDDYLERFHGLAGNLNIIRSSELVMIAYERGYFRKFGKLEKKAVESALYGLKFNGCGISFSEIDEFCSGIK